MKILGIDPGLTGGLAVLAGTLQSVQRMPVINGEINASDVEILLDLVQPDMVVIEAQQSMPKQGVSTTFKTGLNYGKLLGVLESSAHPYVRMQPMEWKKLNGLVGKDKNASRALASNLYPHLREHFRQAKDDGVAESALIARAYQIRYTRQENMA